MKRSRWVLAAGGIAGLLAVYLVVTPFVRDQMLQLTRAFHERSEGEALAHSLVSSESFIAYSATHPEQVAIACWEIGDEGNGLLFNAARSQPASYASALLVLAAYAPEAEHGATVSLAHWERYWLPGTDGGAHLAALIDARASGAVLGDAGSFSLAGAGPAPQQQPSGSVRLNDVVRALVRHADPAAMDVLIDHLGRERLSERVVGLGFGPEAVPLPASAVQMSLLTGAAAPELLARFRALQEGAYADAVWAQFRQLRADDTLRDRSSSSFSLRDRAALSAALAPRGSAAEYARLMEQVVSDALSGAAYMRGQLEQPPSAASDELESFGSLRASEPGIYASVSYGRARGAERTRVLVMMLQKLPMAVWLQLSSGQLLRHFEAGLLSDDALLARAQAKLDPRARTDNRAEAAEARR